MINLMSAYNWQNCEEPLFSAHHLSEDLSYRSYRYLFLYVLVFVSVQQTYILNQPITPNILTNDV
nr:MAG TPA: hypothetical protein [Caudoviricetes sp.]